MNEMLKCKELEILQDINDICEKEKIKYSLAYGTLLGSIRHEGFIPWDDDIDIIMLREDFNRFKKIIQNNHNEKYFVQDYKSEKNYTNSYPKLRMNDTVLLEKSTMNLDIHHGVFVDIFVADYLPTNKILILIQKIVLPIISHIIRAFNLDHVKSARCFSHKIIKGMLLILNKIIPNTILHKIHNSIATIGNKNKSDEVCVMVSEECNFMKRNSMPRRYFDELVKYKFEDSEFYGIKEYDTILTKLYGNYMELPPENKRVAHSFIKIRI